MLAGENTTGVALPPSRVVHVSGGIDTAETAVRTPGTDVPDIGQIVTVRGSNGAVVDVQQQGLGRNSSTP